MAKKQRARQQKDSPDLVNARSSWERGRYAEALHRFGKAIRRQPDHPMALIDAARAFGSRFETDKAAKILARLERIGARQPDLLVEAAQAYQIAHRPGEAVRCFESVLAKHADHPVANYELAALLESANDLQRARELVERSLHAQPGSDEARLLHARLLSRLGDNDFAYATLVELCEPGVRPLVRGEALSMTARIQESEGDYEEAFETMMQSNAALDRISTGAREQAEGISPVLMQLRDSVKSSHLKKWAKLKEDPEGESPPMALMTAPFRSGAGLIGQLLDSHPSVAVANQISVFSEDIFPAALMAGDENPSSRSTELFTGMDDATRQRESARYRQLLLQCLPDRPATTPDCLIDNSPSIVPLIPSFLRIVPSGKLIIPVRDPRDVLVSALFEHFAPERNTVAFSHPFDAADQIRFEMETWLHFRKILDPGRWIEVRYEDLVGDTPAVLARLGAHLGVGIVDSPVPALHDRSVGRWKHYQEQLEPYFEGLEPLREALDYSK